MNTTIYIYTYNYIYMCLSPGPFNLTVSNLRRQTAASAHRVLPNAMRPSPTPGDMTWGVE